MAKQRKSLLIVDGYNVLRSGSRYARISQPDYTDDTFNTAREALINDVIDYAGRSTRAVIVFDGAFNEHSRGEVEKIGGVQIMFSPAGQSADRVIEKLAHDARERDIDTIVVTSDATIQDTVFGGVVVRMSAEGFCREMALHDEGVSVSTSPERISKNTIETRIPAETLQKLKDLRDGKG